MEVVDKLLQVQEVYKTYGKGHSETVALKGITFDVLPGEFLGIMGASESGKTTLLNCIGTMLKPTSDNGIWVLNSDLNFIFDNGFTGDNSNQKKSTGIGLYLVKKLCDELKIEIGVESEYGKGFAIQFLFPIIEV